MPLMENSMDVFVFQKLEEKSARINALWEKADRGNVLDEDSLDPQEVKFALVTDLNVLVDFEIKQIRQDLYKQTSMLESKIKDVTSFKQIESSYNSYKDRIISKVQNIHISNSFLFKEGDENIFYKDVQSLNMD
jgi:hypothetical protein